MITVEEFNEFCEEHGYDVTAEPNDDVISGLFYVIKEQSEEIESLREQVGRLEGILCP